MTIKEFKRLDFKKHINAVQNNKKNIIQKYNKKINHDKVKV